VNDFPQSNTEAKETSTILFDKVLTQPLFS